MSESPYPVGYGRPPEHTRFQKGRSSNPGGKAGPKKRLKQAFEAALSEALDADRWELKDAKPAKVIEAMARQIALDALSGRASDRRLVLSLLDNDGPGGAAGAEGGDLEAETKTETEAEAEARAEESAREALGERYDEYNARFSAAVRAGSVEELQALAREFEMPAEFPASGNFSGNLKKSGE
jgi:hypothetical protein